MKNIHKRKTIDLNSPINLRESNLHATRSESVYTNTSSNTHIFASIQSRRVQNNASVEYSFQIDPALV